MTDDPLAALRSRFLLRCTGDLATIQAAVGDAALRDDPEFRLIIHRLAGTAGTFGFWDISALAGPIDDDLQNGEAPSADQLEALAAGLRALA